MTTLPKGVPPRHKHVLREVDLVEYHERGGGKKQTLDQGPSINILTNNSASLTLTKTAKKLLASVSNDHSSSSKGNVMPVEIQCSSCDGSYPWQASTCPSCGVNTSFPT